MNATCSRGTVTRGCLALALSASVLVGPVFAERLRSDELLLVYNGSNSDSRELVSYYARQRGVPARQVLALTLDASAEEIAQEDFERLIRAPIREHLTRNGLERQVRCLVTFYGMPIRVGKIRQTPEQQRLHEAIEREFLAALDELERAILTLEAIGRARTTAPVHPKPPAAADYQPLLKRYAAARTESTERLGKDGGRETDPSRKAFLELLQKTEGAAPLIAGLRVPEDDANAQAQLARMKQQLAERDQLAGQILLRGSADPQRPEAIRIIREHHGLAGLLRTLDNELSRLRTDETQAAVDSELTLLWWESYSRHRWIYNRLCWRNQLDEGLRAQVPPAFWTAPVLMVARLDGPTPRVVRRMITDAIAAEQSGLQGTVYLDARGLKKDQQLGLYDQSLRDTAAMFWKHTSFNTRLDNKPEVFAPNSCPDAMLYSGWYSLRKYVPALKPVQGAIGYHIASFEAISLKNKGEQGWCRGLLEDGFAATMGPVAEPYLQSFPPPREFFALLVTGRFTLAECYAYTAGMNSWMQMLLGDPLYTPFAARPAARLEDLFAQEELPPEYRAAANTAPATATAGAP